MSLPYRTSDSSANLKSLPCSVLNEKHLILAAHFYQGIVPCVLGRILPVEVGLRSM